MTDLSIAAPPARGGAIPPARQWALHAVTVAALLAWYVYSLFVPAYQVPGPVAVAKRMLGQPTIGRDLSPEDAE